MKFRGWFLEFFLTHIHSITSCRIALVMGNYSPHSADVVLVSGQVKLYPLPTNWTTVHQSMDLYMIAAWKMRYCNQILTEIMTYIEYQARKGEINKKKTGRDEGNRWGLGVIYAGCFTNIKTELGRHIFNQDCSVLGLVSHFVNKWGIRSKRGLLQREERDVEGISRVNFVNDEMAL